MNANECSKNKVSRYVIRLYENGNTNEIEFESEKLPNELYFSDNCCFYPGIIKIEMVKVGEASKRK